MSELLPVFRSSAFRHLVPGLPTTRLLRLSVTEDCNFRCRYCMPVGLTTRASSGQELSVQELTRCVGWLVRHSSIERVKLTGGEPLMRRDLEHLISNLARIDTIQEISMTTNGSLLAHRAASLKSAGLNRVNISLDTLDTSRFTQLSRRNLLKRTLLGIDAAVAVGLLPVKVNAVLHRSTWSDDVPLLLDFAAERKLELRFIELMRTGTENKWCELEYVSADKVQNWLASQTSFVPLAPLDSTPARNISLRWKDSLIKVGWITPRSKPFCAACERLRFDSRGRIRRCLMDSRTLDLAALLAKGDTAAEGAFYSYLAGKHSPSTMDSDSAMSQIGG